MRITKRKMNRRKQDGSIVVLDRYVLNFVEPKTGKRAQRFFDRHRDAQDAMRQLMVQIEQGTYAASKNELTVSQAFEHHYECRKSDVRDQTLVGYEQYRRHICGPLLIGTPKQRIAYTTTGEMPKGCRLEKMLGEIRVNDLSTAEIRKWHKALSDWVGSYSATRAKQHLQTILALAAEDFNAKPPMMPKKHGRGPSKLKKIILKPEQVATVLQQASVDPYGIYYAFPFLAGTRPSEQLGLLWADIDFDKCVIHIRRAVDRKGRVVEVTKTEAGRRDIPMSKALREMLLVWKQLCPRKDGELHFAFPGLGHRQPWPLPLAGGGGVLLYTNFLKRFWRSAFKNLEGKVPYVTPHSARHTFISTLQARGVEVGLVAKIAGHANPVVTLGHYTQAVRGGEEAIEKLSEAYAL